MLTLAKNKFAWRKDKSDAKDSTGKIAYCESLLTTEGKMNQKPAST